MKDKRSWLFYLAQLILLASIYYLAAKWGLSLSPVSGFATYVWPPTGIALAALLLFGRRLWPAIFIGAFIVNSVTGASVLMALGIAIGNTLEALVGATLLKRLGFDRKLTKVRDIVLIVGVAALFSTAISATIGTSSLLIGGGIESGQYSSTWVAWWVGDMLGNLVIAPFILLWAGSARLFDISISKKKQTAEAIALSVLFILTSLALFGEFLKDYFNIASFPYLIFPSLIWAALRFKLRFVVTLVVVLSAFTIWAAKQNTGPFSNGTLRENLLTSQLFMGIAATTFLTFSTAMSERIRAQKTANKLNRKLKKSLNKASEALRQEKELEKLRDQFVAIASHELRAPVTSIKAYAEILERQHVDSKSKKTKQIVSVINTQANKLNLLVNDLIDARKAETNKLVLNKTSFDINKLLNNVIDNSNGTNKKNKIVLEGRIEQKVIGDQNRIEQVIINLLSNAMRFSPKGKEIIVQVGAKKNQALIKVCDQGPGIPKGDQQKIFKRFYRVADNKNNKTSISGLGLGLYIVSEIIKHHNGRIWVESELGKGSNFCFTLPVKK